MTHLWRHQWLRVSTYISLVLLFLPLCIIILLQIPLVQQHIALHLSQVISSDELEITLSPIKGFVPFNFYFDELSLADKQGVWLELKQARLAWSVTALFEGEVKIDDLRIKQLWLKRLPPSQKKPEDSHLIEIPTSIPELDFKLPFISIRHMGIDDIKLEKAVIGQALRLNFIAEAQTIGQQIKARLQLKRTDSSSLMLDWNLLIDLKPLRLSTTLQAHETGGLVALLSQQPDLKGMQLTLKAEGLLTDLSVHLKTQLDGLGKLTTQINMGIETQPWLNLQSKLEITPHVLPSELIDLIGSKQFLDFQLVAIDPHTIQLKKLSLDNDLLALNSQAKIDLSEQTIAATLNLTHLQLDKLNALTGIKLSGKTNLQLAIEGSFMQPQIHLTTQVKHLSINDMSMEALKINLQLSPLKTLYDKQFKMAIHGSVTDLKQHGKALPETYFSWQLFAMINEKQQLDVQEFILNGNWSHLYLKGFLDIPRQQGVVDLDLNLDHINALTSTIQAKVKTHAQINIHPHFEKIDLDLKSHLSHLLGLEKPVSDLVGSALHLNSQLEIIPNQSINVKQLSLKAHALNLHATSLFNLKDQHLNGKLHLKFPYFKMNALALKQASIDLGVQGTLQKPRLDIVATVPQLSISGHSLQAIKLHVTAKDIIENVQGALQINLTHQTQPLTLNTEYALKNNQLQLNQFIINAPKTHLKGDLSINLSSIQFKGYLSGQSDLTALKPWLAHSMQGKLILNTKFNAIKGKQRIQLTTRLEQFKMDALSIAHLNVYAEVDDALEKPTINAQFILEKLKQGQTQLAQLNMVASGILEQLNIHLSIKGQHLHPFNLSLNALVNHTDQHTQVHLQNITGKVIQQKVNLSKMTTLTLSPQKTTLSPFSLFLGQAHLQGKFDDNKHQLAGNLQLGLPLSWVNQFANTALTGQFKTTVQWSGTAKQPKIDLALDLKDLALKDNAFEKFPETQVQLQAHIQSQQLHAKLEIKNPQFKQPLHANLTLPLQLQFSPFEFKLSEQETIQGQFTADLRLEELAKTLPFEGQKLAGLFTTNLRLTGTALTPKLQGEMSLKHGEYQYATTETHFKNIQFQLHAEPKQITLTSISLQDTETGSIQGKGVFSLAKESHYPFAGELNINHLQLANSPDLKTHLSGHLQLTGDINHALVAGQLSIDDFHLRLPSPSNSQDEIPEMAVIEVGKNRPSLKQHQAIQHAQRQQKEFKMNLDVGVTIADQFYIKGYGLDSEWQGYLSLKGETAMPKIIGLMETKRGSLDILSHHFILRQGVIDFNGAYPPLPSLTIEAVVTTEKGDSIINITGKADHPQIALSHQPEIPKSEILSQLLFKENSKNISPLQAIQLAEAVTLLASGGVTNINTLGSLQTGLGLDKLSLGGDSFQSTSVKAGKYMTDKIYLEVEQGLQDQSTQATVEVDLFSEIKAEVKIKPSGGSSVGVKWKHDY